MSAPRLPVALCRSGSGDNRDDPAVWRGVPARPPVGDFPMPTGGPSAAAADDAPPTPLSAAASDSHEVRWPEAGAVERDTRSALDEDTPTERLYVPHVRERGVGGSAGAADAPRPARAPTDANHAKLNSGEPMNLPAAAPDSRQRAYVALSAVVLQAARVSRDIGAGVDNVHETRGCADILANAAAVLRAYADERMPSVDRPASNADPAT